MGSYWVCRRLFTFLQIHMEAHKGSYIQDSSLTKGLSPLPSTQPAWFQALCGIGVTVSQTANVQLCCAQLIAPLGAFQSRDMVYLHGTGTVGASTITHILDPFS